MSIMIGEQDIENAVGKFYEIVKIQRPKYWNAEKDLCLMKKSAKAFIEALKEIDDVEFSYGFDVEKIFGNKGRK